MESSRRQTCPRADLDLSIAFAPHKMRLTGGELETAAPGANGRADVLLLAWPTDAAVPTVLGWVYHTTNVSPGTASNRHGQAYPESRVLWRHCLPLPHLVADAACSLAARLDMPSPNTRDTLDDPVTWRTCVTYDTDPLGIFSQGQASGDDSDSSFDSEL